MSSNSEVSLKIESEKFFVWQSLYFNFLSAVLTLNTRTSYNISILCSYKTYFYFNIKIKDCFLFINIYLKINFILFDIFNF